MESLRWGPFTYTDSDTNSALIQSQRCLLRNWFGVAVCERPPRRRLNSCTVALLLQCTVDSLFYDHQQFQWFWSEKKSSLKTRVRNNKTIIFSTSKCGLYLEVVGKLGGRKWDIPLYNTTVSPNRVIKDKDHVQLLTDYWWCFCHVIDWFHVCVNKHL